MEEKTQINDIDRSIYDIKDEEKDAYRIQEGLTPEIVEKISKEKHDPAWMELFRLQSLQIYNEMKVPDWVPIMYTHTPDGTKLPATNILSVLQKAGC